MILYDKMEVDTWQEMRRIWRRLWDTRGLHPIHRPAPTGYGQAPEVLTEKVQGDGFVMYPNGYKEPNHTMSIGQSPLYGNSYCGTLNSF